MTIRDFIGVWFIILFWESGILFILSFSDKRKIGRALKNVLFALSFVFLYCGFQCASSEKAEVLSISFVRSIVDVYRKIPTHVLVCICSFFTVLGILIPVFIYKWNKSHITSFSIKEAIDTLPSGIAYYTLDGRIVLKNKVIDRLSYDFTGESLLNGLQFETFLANKVSGDDITALRNEKDDSIWSFDISDITVCDEKYRIIVATIITEEYVMSQTLAHKKEDVARLNKRLLEYNKNLVSIISENEVLKAKIKIHDELGLSLIEAKRFIVSGGYDGICNKLKKNIENSMKFLNSELEGDVPDEYELMLNTAYDLGINIFIQGFLPQTEPAKHIVATAIHECLTNMLKYSDGTEIKIRSLEKDNHYVVSFSHNGIKPEKKVVPAGGLLSLETMVEKSGGTMEIMSEPEYVIVITLEKERKKDEIQCFNCG